MVDSSADLQNALVVFTGLGKYARVFRATGEAYQAPAREDVVVRGQADLHSGFVSLLEQVVDLGDDGIRRGRSGDWAAGLASAMALHR
ncbi:hypothetical protein ACIRPX_43195 [Streptomyces sp. NPDC101225]|uniref:hypothetical protein n=1 Tax=Streptomyces sp. NPDC101225 TaxID=3366135 RepID=UPI00381A32F4